MGQTDTTVRQIHKSDEEWKEQLTPEEYAVLRKAGTEAPFTGEYVDMKADGDFTCRGCGAVLFDSNTKFEVRHGLAELHRAGSRGRRRTAPGQLTLHAPHRSCLQGMWRPPRSRLRRRPRRDRPALLHQLLLA